VAFRNLLLWHFPADALVSVNGNENLADDFQFQWLEPLPNFDPFEDKGKQYFSFCRKISLEKIHI
jgi:hypothetical protein